VADTLFFARRLRQAGHHLAGIMVNQVHPNGSGAARQRGSDLSSATSAPDGPALLAWLGERDARGLVALRQLVTDGTPVADLALLPEAPTGLAALELLGRSAAGRLDAIAAVRYNPPAMRRGRRHGRPAPGGGNAWSG
jgi:hypothetical protein